MLIFHTHPNSGNDSSAKKEYKSVNKRKNSVSQAKVLEQANQKKKKLRKKLLKKNRQYLEGLGLKVKPNN